MQLDPGMLGSLAVVCAAGIGLVRSRRGAGTGMEVGMILLGPGDRDSPGTGCTVDAICHSCGGRLRLGAMHR